MSNCSDDIPKFSFPVTCGNHKNLIKKLKIFNKQELPRVDVYFIGHNDEVLFKTTGTIVDHNRFPNEEIGLSKNTYELKIQYNPL